MKFSLFYPLLTFFVVGCVTTEHGTSIDLTKPSLSQETLDSYVTILTSLTGVTVRPSEAKVTHADAVCPQRFTISVVIAVWTKIVVKLASQLCVPFKQWI